MYRKREGHKVQDLIRGEGKTRKNKEKQKEKELFEISMPAACIRVFIPYEKIKKYTLTKNYIEVRSRSDQGKRGRQFLVF